MISFLKKYHKWLSLIFAIIIILFSISGIILNHRNAFSGMSVSRDILPKEYSHDNWNNAGVKSTLKLTDNNFLIYGNIGIWQTDSTFSNYVDFNKGLPEGIDNRKICSMFKSSNNELYVGTFFGLYKYYAKENIWKNIELPTHEQRVVDIIEKDKQLIFMTRSHLVYSDLQLSEMISKELPKPQNYDNKIGLFKTLWTIHSGEIYGEIGKLFVDLMGLILIFLTVTGVIIFINKQRIKPRALKEKNVEKIIKTNRWSLKWHNKVGWITTFFLIITTLTGMFLRPPLLIPIANVEVSKIPGTELATSNAWFDKLRRIIYDDSNSRFIIATLDGIYYSDDNLQSELKAFAVQPPASVMGVNVFKMIAPNTILIGSFEGLFAWNTSTNLIMDYITGEPYKRPEVAGPPIGDFLVTAFSDDFNGQEIAFLYGHGALNISGKQEFPQPTQNIQEHYRMSLWNLALEVHTGRIYSFFMGIFYILVVPISGLAILFILISGFIVWWKLHR